MRSFGLGVTQDDGLGIGKLLWWNLICMLYIDLETKVEMEVGIEGYVI